MDAQPVAAYTYLSIKVVITICNNKPNNNISYNMPCENKTCYNGDIECSRDYL